MIIGKVRNYGEGCACPLNYLTKILLKNLILQKDEAVLVDTDAGVEHVGRGVEEGTDAILAIIDPTAESLTLAKTLKETFKPLHKNFWTVLNKATPSILNVIREKAKETHLGIDGIISFDEEIFRSCLEGERLRAGGALRDIESLLSSIGLP